MENITRHKEERFLVLYYPAQRNWWMGRKGGSEVIMLACPYRTGSGPGAGLNPSRAHRGGNVPGI